jgi:hypothetical protein
LAIIRTSDSTGYYVDIFRSDNGVSNDYLYHNIGDSVLFYAETGELLKTNESSYPKTENDYPGFRFFTDVRKLEKNKGNLVARFPVKNSNGTAYLQALIAGAGNRDYYTAYSPKTKTAGRDYYNKPLPLFTIHTEGEAQTTPFTVVYEPFRMENGNNVLKMETSNTINKKSSILKVFNRDSSMQIIYQSDEPSILVTQDNETFAGYFGVAGYSFGKLTSLYLGKGSQIAIDGYSIRMANDFGSAYLGSKDGNFSISCDQEITLSIPGMKKVQKVILKTLNGMTKLNFRILQNGISVTVPAVQNGWLIFEGRSLKSSSLPSGKK